MRKVEALQRRLKQERKKEKAEQTMKEYIVCVMGQEL